MKDLREKVKDERTLLKKIELAIPGFRGYRKREDLRIADSMLRDYLANQMDVVEDELKIIRKILSRRMMMEVLEDISSLVNRMSALEGKVRHAEQGYMGLVGDYRVDEPELNRVYEFDLSLIGKIKLLKEKAEHLHDVAKKGGIDDVIECIEEMDEVLSEFDELFDTRRNVMLEVFK